MNLDRIRLANILDTLKISTGNKVMEVSNQVKFVIDRESHAVYLSTTDFHSFLVVDFGDVALTNLDDVPEVFLINFKQLYDLVKASTTQDVAMASDGESIRVVTNGSFRFPLYKDPTQFPTADFSFEPAGEWNADDLQHVWEKVSLVASKDVTKVSYQGVNFDGNWAASDNRRFAVVMNDSEEPYQGKSMLLPVTFGDVVSKCTGHVTIGPNTAGNMVVLSNPESGIMAAMRLLDASFVQYQRILGGRQPYIKVKMPKQHLLGTLQRMACFTDKLFKVGVFTVIRDNDIVSLRCSIQHESSEGTEAVQANEFEFADEQTPSGQVVTFQYQIDNLAAGINAVDSKEEVEINFQSDGKLWIDEGNFHYLLSRISS